MDMRLVGASNRFASGRLSWKGDAAVFLGFAMMIIFYPIVVWVDPKIASVFSGVSLFRYYIDNFGQDFRDSFGHRHSDLLCLQPHRGKKIFEDIERRPLRDHRMARLASRSDSESRRVGWLFMFFVYILKSQVANKSYVGHTDDLDKED